MDTDRNDVGEKANDYLLDAGVHRVDRSKALSLAIEHSGRHVTTEHIIQKAQDFAAFLSGTPTAKSVAISSLLDALRKRRIELGLGLDDMVPVGAVLLELDRLQYGGSQ
jgi:hypothetical protein